MNRLSQYFPKGADLSVCASGGPTLAYCG